MNAARAGPSPAGAGSTAGGGSTPLATTATGRPKPAMPGLSASSWVTQTMPAAARRSSVRLTRL